MEMGGQVHILAILLVKIYNRNGQKFEIAKIIEFFWKKYL